MRLRREIVALLLGAKMLAFWQRVRNRGLLAGVDVDAGFQTAYLRFVEGLQYRPHHVSTQGSEVCMHPVYAV